MAKDFVFRSDWLELINELPKDEQPEVCRAVMLYCSTGKNIRLPEVASIVFNAIKRDIAKREQLSKTRKEAGSKGGRASWNFAQAKLKQSSSKAGAKVEHNLSEAQAKDEHSHGKIAQNVHNQYVTNVQEGSTSMILQNQEKEEKEKKKNPPTPPYKEKEIKEKKEVCQSRARKVFQKPTVDEVAAYIREKLYLVDANQFHAWYEANGWKVGKNPMKDWKAAVRTWHYKKIKEYGNTAYRNNHQSAEDRQHQETLTAMRRVDERGESNVGDEVW